MGMWPFLLSSSEEAWKDLREHIEQRETANTEPSPCQGVVQLCPGKANLRISASGHSPRRLAETTGEHQVYEIQRTTKLHNRGE